MFGLDLLGLARYPKVALANFPDGWSLGCFSSTFGDSRKAVEAIIKSGKCPRVRIHLWWADRHDIDRDDFPAIDAEARKWKGLVAKYPYIDWRFSGCAEHNLSLSDSLILAENILDILPGITYVNNPMKQGAADIMAGRIITERHGSEAVPFRGRYNFSFDGSPCVDTDVTEIKNRLESTETFFFWTSQFNGRRTATDNTPRPNRKAWPSAELIRSVVYLATKRGRVNLPYGWLLKSHSEDVGGPRALKPVFIVPLKTSKIVLKANGKVVATLPYYGRYTDGRHRYYSPSWGYQIAEKAKKILGSPVCEVWADGKKIGTTNPAFRQGSYRD